MVNSCVCFGCNNSNLSGHRVHRFPNKKHKDFRAWIRFVQAKRSNFAASSLTRHTVVCEKHFTPDSYNQGDLMEFRMGFRRKEWVRLANGAVPSVHASPPAKSGGSEESNVNVSTSRESARRKRELCTIMGESAASKDGAGATATSDPDGDGDISTMDPEPELVHRGSQCSGKPEELESLSDPNAVDKFIVCQRQLLSLFTVCPACCGETQGRIMHPEGTFIKVKQACGTCGYERYWQNQEKVQRNMPACNLLLSGAIHFSGCMATQTIRMLKLFGLQCISPGTFFRHHRYYTIPTIVQAWRNEQSGIIRELKETGGGLILSGDCRSDSPGHCAKYGSYSLIEDRINKVLDVQLVQSSEVPSSSWCELEGLKRSMQFLMDQDMQVSALITDRNRQVAKWVREKMCSEGTKHFFDVWHIGKSVQKALDAAAKERDCEDLKLWRPAIINHLYWTAASTPTGDPDEMQAKWQSMINHVQDIHEHSSLAFTSCAHPPLEGEARNKEWLEPGTT
ncbi:uncharacterized protein LOC132098844 [Carassius carassius]|uniref:uncharacterized protein LOC132098844 n=1 Tax=Carassius carassius TaxID=217509 RepID=UPI0028694BBC|nr:uncharacterized protein LOC132098844 [Carassius carassius]